MYLTFDEDRPEIPRVHSPISRFRGIEVSLLAHIAVIAFVLFGPRLSSADRVQAVPAPLLEEPVRFVHMSPMIDRTDTPIRPAEHSDANRRSATTVRPRDAQNPLTYSRGNTSEKVVGAPEEKPAPAPSPPPAPPSSPPSNATDPVANGLIPPAAVPVPPAPESATADRSLGQSLRDLRRYLQRENFDNQRGGLVDEQQPDIQFDSKGVEFGPWLRRFIEQVKRNWYVPQSAQFLTGRVVLQFYVEKNGAITELSVVTPSQVEAFTRSSLNAIKNSNPTMPLPPEYPLPRALFTVTFHYNERLDTTDR
jgi:TonB family protein